VSARTALAWGITGCVLALAQGCGGKSDTPEAAPDPQVDVAVAHVQVRQFRDAIEAPGSWKGAGELVLRAPAAGNVETLTPRVGDTVAEGQTVGEIVTRESRAALEGARTLAAEARSDSGRAQAARALRLAERELVHLRLKAPGSGVVTRRSVEPGALVDDGAELLALVPHGGRVFEAHVPASKAGRVRAGQAAEIYDVGGAVRAATVKRVLPAVDSTDQASLVWLAPERVDPEIALDRFQSARILTGSPRRAPAVPDSALVEDDVTGERRIAIVGKDGRAQWIPVRLGADEGGWAEVISPGLADSTRVVVRGQRGLPEHARLTIGR
jgi:RND family efflux transporter MFP subunit